MLLLAAAVPPLLVARAVDRYGVNVPYWDQWQFVPTLIDTLDGRLQWSELWAQHNEHRLVLPRLVMLALAVPSHWNVRWEMATSLLLNGAALALLAGLIRRTVRPFAAPAVPWLVLVASILLFSLSQWENWASGWQLQIFMLVVAAVLAAWLLARWDGGWRGLVLMLAVGVCAVLSFGSGLVLLALLVPAAWVAVRTERLGVRTVRTAVAVAVLAAVTAVYYVGFSYPSHHPSPLYIVHHPLDYAMYVAAYVGAGFGAWDPRVAALWGGPGLVVFAIASVFLWRRSPEHRRALLPWLLLAVFAVGSGAITGVGRLGLGVSQAIAARYIALSALFWVSLVVVVTLAVFDRRAAGGRRGVAGSVAAMLVVGCAAVGYGRSWEVGRVAMHERQRALERGGACLHDWAHAPDPCLTQLFVSPDWVRSNAAALERHGFGPFAGPRVRR